MSAFVPAHPAQEVIAEDQVPPPYFSMGQAVLAEEDFAHPTPGAAALPHEVVIREHGGQFVGRFHGAYPNPIIGQNTRKITKRRKNVLEPVTPTG